MSSIGVDTGGTFSDLVYLTDDGRFEVAKRPSTPADFSVGILDVAESIGGRAVLEDVQYFYHGTTVATNAMITGNGVKLGFITTAGHRDMLPMMRIIGRSAGQTETELKQYSYTDKPAPIVPKTRIQEIQERVGFRGRVVMPLNEDSVRRAVRAFAEAGVEAIAVCLLWSFMNPAHEQRVREIIVEEAPGMHVSLSSEIAPAIHEYERAATTVVNAYLAPVLSDYLDHLAERLAERGLRAPLYVMQSLGGVMRTSDVEQRTVNTLESGPAGGVIAARFLGDALGHKNIICADVGGTSFDVGLLVEGNPVVTSTSVVNGYSLLVPSIDIVSIGAGGGSIARAELGRLLVGPQSAGADPGPACYGKGGTYPTVTDADVVLGYIDPDYFLGGHIKLDRDLAAQAIAHHVAEPLGMSIHEAAAGIVEIANHHMSDLIRKMTIERGYDPRDFVVYAYGGAGPLHGAAFGREIGAEEVIFPLGPLASAFSALGLATSDLVAVAQLSDPALAPFDLATLNARFSDLDRQATARVTGQQSGHGVRVQRTLELRYKGQVHQVDTPVPNGELTADDLNRILVDFEHRYEQLYGRGSGYRPAGVELQTYRVAATAQVSVTALPEHLGATNGVTGQRTTVEDIYWPELHGMARTDVYRDPTPHTVINGPAVIRLTTTTALVLPNQTARVDNYGNIRIRATAGEG